MSISHSESSSKRRTSERRRLKLLKNSKEFKMANPYRFQKEEIVLPDDLCKQLRKIDYLSSTSISMLSFQKENTPTVGYENILEKMTVAFQNQEERYQSLFGCSDSSSSSHTEELESQPFSEYIRKDHSLAQEVITTKEEISLNLYDPHYPMPENMFDCHVEEEEQQILDSSDSFHQDMKAMHEKPFQVMVMDEEYENYFIN